MGVARRTIRLAASRLSATRESTPGGERMNAGTLNRQAAIVLALLAFAAGPARGSYAIYVGKNLTADGSVFLAGYGDEPSSHWLEIVPARDWPAGATIKVGATAAASYPGEL